MKTGFKNKLIVCIVLSVIVPISATATVHAVTENTLVKREMAPIGGIVVDEADQPIIGATVTDVSTDVKTVTDMNGKFSISSTIGHELKISYLGYEDYRVQIKDDQKLNVKLITSEKDLNEVVVVGYGVQKKVNLSGAVDQINAKDLEKKPITDLSKGLQGVIPNLNIDFTSGEPGQTANINVRGIASINGGSPLILIDGVATTIDEMNRLQPQDIESISVLKDASSAAIYGARSAFGVILITTKRGTSKQVKIDYNNSFSWKRPSQLTNKTADPYIYLKLENIAVLNTPWSSGHVTSDEKLEWARQRSDNPNGTESTRLNPLDKTQWDYMGNRDWTKYFLDKYSFNQTHQVSISGASDKVDYYLSAGIDTEDGILSRLAKDTYTRFSTRSNVNYKVYDWLTIGNNTYFTATTRNKPRYYNIDDLFNAIPSDVDKNKDGTWANTDLGWALAKITDGGVDNTETDKLQSTFSVKASFLDKLIVLNANYSFARLFENRDYSQYRYNIGYGPDDVRPYGNSYAWKGSTRYKHDVLDIYATISKKFNEHDVSLITGYNQEYESNDYFTGQRNDLISSSLPSLALASGDQQVNEQYRDWAIRGFFFRANYSYADRYLFEMDGRYDGSSRFPKERRFGFFPSASVAWRIDSEPFFQSMKNTVSQLKLRASYGSLGNQLVTEYGYIPFMSSALGYYIIDGKLQQTVLSPGLVSPDYTWENVRTLNGGIDIGFFDNRLTATFDIYRRKTLGMLTLGKELPGVLGASEPKENAADLSTDGWELSVAYTNRWQLAKSPLSLTARFVLSDNTTKITRFDNPNKNLNQYYVGQTLGEIWGLKNDGMFKTKEEIAQLDESQIIPWGALSIVPGWPKYKDLNGDKQITKGTTAADPGDLSIIGNASPRFRYGFNLSADWNGFDFSAFFQGIGKRDYYPLSYLYWSFFQQPYTGGQVHAFDFYRAADDSPEDMAKHSKSYIAAGLANQNLNAKYPIMQSWLADKNLGTSITDAMGLAIPQTGYMLNGAYLRIKNITIGYTLPKDLTRKAHIERLRIFVSGDNLFEWSELKKYFDPEAVTNADSFGYVYPFNRQYIIGLNITF